MPWGVKSIMSLRREFVQFALSESSNIRQLCRRYGISAKTGYKWILRYRRNGEPGLSDRSRRPRRSPERTQAEMEEKVLKMRKKHETWGGRKIRARLVDQGNKDVPAVSTITAILRRHGKIDPQESAKRGPWQRFEHEAPNDLWQMDFKGHFAMDRGRCHPLTVLDDHSRFALSLQACADQQGPTVQMKLTRGFRSYGLPGKMLMDNGAPWGSDRDHPFTPLTAWLIRLGIQVIHSRPYHPQTLGKDERFHRTLKADVLANRIFRDLQDCQKRFDEWRMIYNLERPHEALAMQPPVRRYQPSPRCFPEILPPIEYEPGDIVRKVQAKGEIFFRNRVFKVGKAFHGYPVALRPTQEDGIREVFFCHQKISQINLKDT